MIRLLTLLLLMLMSTGCVFVVDDDCHISHPDYSHTEDDCDYRTRPVRVCDRGHCWRESRTEHHCYDVHVCHYRGRYR